MPTLPVFKIFKKYRLNKTTKTTPSITSPHHTSGSHKGSTSQISKASQSSSVASTSGTEKEVRLDAMFYKHLEEMHRKEFLSEANRFYRVVDQKPDRTFLSRPIVMRNGNHSSPIQWAE